MTATMADLVLAISQDMFTAMIDGEPGHLAWGPGTAGCARPVRAWVEIGGEQPVRLLAATDRGTAERITRGLLGLGPQETVGPDDVRDALGEVANVVGGNLKGLMSHPGPLSLPSVTFDVPRPPDGALLWERTLQWDHDLLAVSMWDLTSDRKEQPQ